MFQLTESFPACPSGNIYARLPDRPHLLLLLTDRPRFPDLKTQAFRAVVGPLQFIFELRRRQGPEVRMGRRMTQDLPIPRRLDL